MSNGEHKLDKTRLFKELEAELKATGLKLGTIGNVLSDTERVLQPLFENSDALHTALKLGALEYDGAFLLRKASESWIQDSVRLLLSEFRAARTCSPAECYARWSGMMESTNRAITNGATTAQLQNRYANLETPLFARSYFRDIADILEGSLQNFIRLRLTMIEVGGFRKKCLKCIDELSFGDIVAELIELGKGQLYQPLPHGVALSQWRNIANHHSYECEGDKIVCVYGSPNKRKSFECTRDDIWNLAYYVGDLNFAHKVAVEIFGIDNLQHVHRPGVRLQVTDFTKDSTLAYGLTASGFSVREVILDNKVWNLTLFDERGRNEARAKAALEEACVSYALLAGGCHVEALVRSVNVTYNFGFKTNIQRDGEPIPENFRGTIRRFDEQFHLGPELS